MTYLIILNDPPYGTERSYNGLRLANTLVREVNTEVKLFLMGDAAACAVSGQITPNGFYNLERMLKAVLTHNAKVGVCGTCMDARGIKAEAMVSGTHRSKMEELTQWTQESDKVIVF